MLYYTPAIKTQIHTAIRALRRHAGATPAPPAARYADFSHEILRGADALLRLPPSSSLPSFAFRATSLYKAARVIFLAGARGLPDCITVSMNIVMMNARCA